MLWMLMLFWVKKAQIVHKNSSKMFNTAIFYTTSIQNFQFLPFFDNFEFLLKYGGQYGGHLE